MVLDEYPNYAVSNRGEVTNIKYHRYLAPRVNTRGYLMVTLYGKRGGKQLYIHQLVAQAFFPDWMPGVQVRHVDEDRSHNHVSNLRVRHGNAHILRPEIARRVKIRETGMVFRTIQDCADYINGASSNVSTCLRGRRKSHKGFTFEYLDKKEG